MISCGAHESSIFTFPLNFKCSLALLTILCTDKKKPLGKCDVTLEMCVFHDRLVAGFILTEIDISVKIKLIFYF